MVHRMVKAALEYVSQIPSDSVGNIIDKLDQELNRMSDSDSPEEQLAKKPLYPLDSKNIFQMLDKPRAESRTNLILQYEMPGAQEPQCREALEKLIEIAYNAYLELEQQPQCREYLYRFASQHSEDRPKGHLEYGPDLKSVIATILEQIEQNKAKNSPDYPHADYYSQLNGYEVPSIPELPIPTIHEIVKPQIPQIHDINIPQIHEVNIPQYHDITEIREIKIPQIHEIKVPQIHEINIPQYHDITEIHDIQLPKIKMPYEMNHPQYHDRTDILDIKIPNNHDIKFPQIHEHNVPQYHDVTEIHDIKLPKIKIPQIHDINIPQYHDITEIRDIKIPQTYEINHPHPQYHDRTDILDIKIPNNHDIKFPQIHEIPQYHDITEIHDIKLPKLKIPQIPQINHPYHDRTNLLDIQIPQIHELNIPQYHDITKIREYTIPQIQEIPQILEYNIPQINEYVDETGPSRPLQPEETVKVIVEMLQNEDTSDLFDRLMRVIEENRPNFHPQVFEILLTLLTIRKERHVPRFRDLVIFLLDSERNKQWPWSETVTEHVLEYLLPDKNGHLDSKLVDIILNLYHSPTNDNQIEFILSLLRPIKEGNIDSKIYEIILRLIKSYQNDILKPDQIEILLNILSPQSDNIIEIEVIDQLLKYKELGITPEHVDILLQILKPGPNRPQNINFILFLLKEVKHTMPYHLGELISFLFNGSGILDKRRIGLLYIIIHEYPHSPDKAEALLNLLKIPSILDSRFVDIMMLLNSYNLLSVELFDTLLNLLNDEVNGQINDHRVKTLIMQLGPLKQSFPTLSVDILSLLSQGGYPGPDSVVEWIENASPNHEEPYSNIKALLDKVETLKDRLIHDNLGPDNEFRTTDDGFTVPGSPDNDFFVIFKWLESQGLLNPDQGGANNDLVNKLLKILEMGERELGVVELTYMLKHEKPLVYQPVYYVKYRLPILSFISNMKSLLVENPHLTADPLKLLQELIVISNVTEVSPNLQGYPKDEILKLTFNDGDLVQAKILDEQNLNLNEQITYVHGLNADISPEEILQLNKINEAKYYPNVLHIKETFPEKVTVHEINKYVEYPPVHYQRTKEVSETDPALPAPKPTPFEKPVDDKASQPNNVKA